jgi:hypothetical protein
VRCLANDLLKVFYQPVDSDACDLVLPVADSTDRVIRELWGVQRPERKCRMYITESGIGFVFRAAPWHFRLWYGLCIPFYWYEIWRAWREAGGWTVGHRRQAPATAVKPPRILERSTSRMGRLLFPQSSTIDKFKHIVCHELTHAYTIHLGLPFWLNEGLAMLTVDRYFGEIQIRPETLDILGKAVDRIEPRDYRYLSSMSDYTIVAHYARGYWTTRYLDETIPDTLRDLLRTRLPRKSVNKRIAQALGMDYKTMWKHLDRRAHSHFVARPPALLAPPSH